MENELILDQHIHLFAPAETCFSRQEHVETSLHMLPEEAELLLIIALLLINTNLNSTKPSESLILILSLENDASPC